MILRLLIVALALFGVSSAEAQTSKILGSGILSPGTSHFYGPMMVLNSATSSAPSTTALTYIALSPVGFNGSGWTATPAQRRAYIPSAVTLRNLIVRSQTTMGAGNTITFTVMKNGAATPLQCYVSSSQTVCSCNVTSPQNCSSGGTSGVSFAAGDYVYIQACPQTNDPPSLSGNTCSAVGTSTSSAIDLSLLSDSINGDAPIFGGTGGSLTTSGSGTYNSVGILHGNTATDAAEANVVPNGNGGSGTVGTLNNFYAYGSTTPTGATYWTITIYKNGSPTAITCQLDLTHNPCSDTTHSITVAAGDTLSTQTVPSASAPLGTLLNTGINWTPTTAGEYPIFQNGGAMQTAAAVRYINIAGYSGAGFGTSAGNIEAIAPASTSITFKGPSVAFGVAPGGATARTTTVYSGSAANSLSASSVACVATGAAATCTQAPSTTLTVTGSAPGALNYVSWVNNCTSGTCAANTWIHTSVIATVVP